MLGASPSQGQQRWATEVLCCSALCRASAAAFQGQGKDEPEGVVGGVFSLRRLYVVS